MAEAEVKPEASLLASPRGELPSDIAYSLPMAGSTDSIDSLLCGALSFKQSLIP